MTNLFVFLILERSNYHKPLAFHRILWQNHPKHQVIQHNVSMSIFQSVTGKFDTLGKATSLDESSIFQPTGQRT